MATPAPIIAGAKSLPLLLKLLHLTSTPAVGHPGQLTIKSGVTVLQTGTPDAIMKWLKKTRKIQ